MSNELNKSADTVAEVAPVAGALWLLSLAASVLGLWMFFWLAKEFPEGDLQRFDTAVRMAAHNRATPALTLAMQIISNLGGAYFLTAQTAIALLIFVLRKWRRAAVMLLIAMTGAAALNVVLKLAFHRARPDALFVPLPDSYSFPSGHALGSICFYGAMAALLAARTRGKVNKSVIWLAAAALVLAIGFSRIYLGVHWPSDVIAGFAAGATWLVAVISVDRKIIRTPKMVRTWFELKQTSADSK